MSAINPTSIARAKEAIAAGKKLQATEPQDDATPAKGTKAAAKGGSKPTKEDKAAAKAAKEAEKAKAAKEKEAAAKAKAKEKEAAEKAKAKEAKEKEAAAAKAKREAEKAKEKEEKAAEYKAKIEAQKAATVERHKHEKLFNSFRARVKYMIYMDNPALGGLEGRENLGWCLTHTNSTGSTYVVERRGESVMVYVQGETGEGATRGYEPIESEVLAAMSEWTA